MDPAIRALLDHLAERGVPCMPALEDDALAAFESALGEALPEAVRALYRACGGMGEDTLHHLPMRLMSPDEALETQSILRDGEAVYAPARGARYLFTDDQSNWVGVFVTGPLTGKLVILDHDETVCAPRFRTLSSFLESIIDAGRNGGDFTTLRTDYPLGPGSDARSAPEELRLASEFLAQMRATEDIDLIIPLVETVTHLLPASEVVVLRELLQSPHQYVRWLTLRLAEKQKQAALVPELVDYAGRAKRGDIQGGGDPYTHWQQAVLALIAIGADDAVAAQRVDKPSDWPMPF